MARRPKIGFVLGAGSARGWAHIGVLRALTEEGIKPDIIAGCSIGALVGAAFAADRLDQLEAWARALDWKRVLRLLDFSLRGGLIKGKRVIELFREQIVECRFTDLPVQFAAVATDLASGQEVWLREGSVSEAVRASIAVPGLFRPILYEDRAPTTRANPSGVMSKLFPWYGKTGDAPPAPELSPPSLLEALMGSINIMQVRIARSRLAGEPPDVLVTPRLGHLGLLDYHRAEPAIAEGRKAVARMLPAIRSALPA